MKYSLLKTILFCAVGIPIIWFGYQAYLAWALVKDAPPCEHRARIIASDGVGDKVEFDEDICDYFVHSGTGSLYLLTKAGGRKLFLEYDLGDENPRIRWDKGGGLLVSLSPARIFTQKSEVQGVHVRYVHARN